MDCTNSAVIENVIQKREYSYSEAIFAFISFILGFLFIKLFPAAIRPFGSLLFILSMFISSFIFMIIKGVKPRPFPSATAIISIVLSFALILNTNFYVNTIIFICAALSYVYWIFSAFGNNIGKNKSNYIFLDSIKALFIMPFSEFISIFPASASIMRHVAMKKIFFALCGFAAAIIPTTVVIMLLSYDAGFSEIIDNILFSGSPELFRDNILLFIAGIPIAMYFYGLLYSCSHQLYGNTMTAEACEKGLSNIKVIPTVATVFALIPILAVYIIFFFSQASYYLSAFSHILPEGLSYAKYARSGFFELCTVAVINALLIAAANGLTRIESNASKITVKFVNTAFSLSTVILIVTALSKMVLYINKYGFTEKRILSTWLMIMMLFGFVVFILKQFIPKIKLGISYLLLFLIFTLPLSFCNIDAVIAKYNVDNYLNGSLEKIDVYALSHSGASAVPSLIKLSESGNTEAEIMLSHYEFPEDIFEITLPDFIAKKLLEK